LSLEIVLCRPLERGPLHAGKYFVILLDHLAAVARVKSALEIAPIRTHDHNGVRRLSEAHDRPVIRHPELCKAPLAREIRQPQKREAALLVFISSPSVSQSQSAPASTLRRGVDCKEVHCTLVAAAQKPRTAIMEREALDLSPVSASPQLLEQCPGLGVKDPDQCTFVRSGCEERAVEVERDHGDPGLVLVNEGSFFAAIHDSRVVALSSPSSLHGLPLRAVVLRRVAFRLLYLRLVVEHAERLALLHARARDDGFVGH